MGIKEDQRERCWTTEATTEVECQGLKAAENKDEILVQRIRILFVCLHVELFSKQLSQAASDKPKSLTECKWIQQEIQEHLHIGRIYKWVWFDWIGNHLDSTNYETCWLVRHSHISTRQSIQTQVTEYRNCHLVHRIVNESLIMPCIQSWHDH